MRNLRPAAALTTTLFFSLLAAAPLPGPPPAPLAAADEPTSTTRTAAPNTDTCPHQFRPPQVDSTSEIPAPGTPSLAPLPTAKMKAGGGRMSECGIISASDFQLPPGVHSSAWIVYDLDTGDVLAAKDPHGRYRPASIIKVLLAIVAIQELDPHKEVVVGRESAEMEGSAAGIGEGGRYTVEQLLHGLLLASGNDTAHALAQELGGDAATLDKINTLAMSIGTQDTRPASYTGLDAPGMSTSAFDMALVYRYAWTLPEFARIVATPSYDFPGWGDNPGFQLWNDNQMLHDDPTSIGGKTGFTDAANHTYVGAVDRDGRRTAVVILDSTTETTRTWQQGQQLIDAALASHPDDLGVVEPVLQPVGGVGAGVVPSASPTPTAPIATPTPSSTRQTQAMGAVDTVSHSEEIATWKILTPLCILATLVGGVLLWALVQLRIHK